ncbi:hypothetical protein HK104_001723 [Borealophlyctis nickersoniae]|nr:hypothetical protein HK104_001723 [Borealophlyctis nickersoniae]
MSTEIAQSCCTMPPFTSEYKPKGSISNVGNLPLYFTGEKGKKAVLVIYDIFGMLVPTQQFVDRLAEQGFYVAMPDYFRGNPWKKVPFKLEELMAHLNENVPYDNVIVPDSKAVISHLKSEGVESVGVLGFCWGGLMATKLAADESTGLKAVASAHPSFVSADLVKTLKVPAAYLPSHEEPDFGPIMETLKDQPFASKNVHVRFDDMHHGFCAGRADFSNPANAKRAADAVDIFAKFYKNVLAFSSESSLYKYHNASEIIVE